VIEDGEEDPQPHPDQHWRLIALTCAAECFPELRPLLPLRPLDACRCVPCEGRGYWRWAVPEGKGLTPCGSCQGLGWIPPRLAEAEGCPRCQGKGRFRCNSRSASTVKPAASVRGWVGWLMILFRAVPSRVAHSLVGRL